MKLIWVSIRILGASVFLCSLIGFYHIGKLMSRSNTALSKRSIQTTPSHQQNTFPKTIGSLIQDVPKSSLPNEIWDQDLHATNTKQVDEDEDVRINGEFSALDPTEKEPTMTSRGKQHDARAPLVRDIFQHSWKVSGADICQKKPKVDILVVVISSPSHILQRNSIRESWGEQVKERKRMALLFILGRSPDLDQHVINESIQYEDIVLTNHEDTYENLSLKILAALQWYQDFCPQAKYLVKVDDDVFMQIPRLHTLLAGMNRSKLNHGKKLILGNVASGWAPSHEINSKYYISPKEFNKTVFPAFVTGPSYVISTPAIPELLALAWDHPYIPLEDVFITGILAEMANVPRRLVMEFRNNAARIPAKFLGCTLLRTISIHQVTPFEQKEMTILARNPQCGPPK
ncbi:hypothetical protein TCAL_02825 [Tigriopus californicus]|uniref:Hexosyltransferase n=1 Tax=Tigriopus californicus TaxID=6832 RepID=A0A553NWX2_TIGCA|nr:beta-1,3-galactosyltransferase 5-like isoform X2 [Tigriopus californicus]TRY69931.1 hypothetical protein TCAL_02825 [Tigriopus californicus]|eukprot:TCALIF_02825-PA protein Name:"Similar to B3GALT2 Beta-1,3-galactosyltransferase 2 (Pongo abelii)" AED:0.04 eAED:0.04 QI:154/1/1/1/1/1/3/17/401